MENGRRSCSGRKHNFCKTIRRFRERTDNGMQAGSRKLLSILSYAATMWSHEGLPSQRSVYSIEYLMTIFRTPQAFIKPLSKESQSFQQTVLKGPSGNSWHVRLNITSDGMPIQDGWGTFSKGHSLHKTDFLVFTYDADMHFSVRMFDTSAYQREDAFTVTPSQEPPLL